MDGGFGAFCLTEPGAGSDASAGKTTAVKDGDSYILNGRKCFITNGGVASFYCVTAMTDKSAGVKGMSMFFIEAGTPGLSTGHEGGQDGYPHLQHLRRGAGRLPYPCLRSAGR